MTFLNLKKVLQGIGGSMQELEYTQRAMSRDLTELKRRAGEIADLQGIGGLMLWDQNTMMPLGGSDARADQFAALERILHDRVTDPELGALLARLEPWAAEQAPEDDDAALHRNLSRDRHKAVNVPTELAADVRVEHHGAGEPRDLDGPLVV